jgi:hypothetical protein
MCPLAISKRLIHEEGVYMGLGSQNLTNKEKRLFRKIVNAANEAGEKKRVAFDKRLARISKSIARKNSAVSKNIAARIRKDIIDPYRKKNPNR